MSESLFEDQDFGDYVLTSRHGASMDGPRYKQRFGSVQEAIDYDLEDGVFVSLVGPGSVLFDMSGNVIPFYPEKGPR